MSQAAETIRYTPQTKQQIALSRSEDLLFYGGAKGGGKSDFLLIDYLSHAERYAAGSRGIIFRRTYNELEELIHRSRQLYLHAEFSETKKTWTFPNGASLKMRFVEADQDVSRYQGHQYSWIGMDELTEWPTDFCMVFILSCLRSAEGADCYFRASGNPGRIGHQWVKAYFIDVAPPMQPYERVIPLPDGRSASMWQIYIPASLDDNTALMQSDPLYEARLALLPPYLYEAFRHGNWDVIAGAAFSELRRDIHGIDPANPPERLLRVFDFERMTPKDDIKIFRSFDWGYARPFSFGWYFSDYDGRLYRYRELYGCKSPDKGIEMPARDVAIKVRQIEQEHNERVVLSIADASIWDKPSNQNEAAEKLPSIAETMGEEGIWFDRDASIDAKKSRLQGKHQLHERFRLDGDGLPSLFVFNTCVHWWRTVPAIPIDRLNPEDVDTDAEDHCYDETRYVASSRPMSSRIQQPAVKQYSVNWFYKRSEQPEGVYI